VLGRTTPAESGRTRWSSNGVAVRRRGGCWRGWPRWGSGRHGDLVHELADAVGGDLEAHGHGLAVGGRAAAGGGDDLAVAAQVYLGGGAGEAVGDDRRR
jgi:hypothetical protein